MWMSDLVEEVVFQAGWKCVLAEDGGLYVMMNGRYLMQKLYVNNLASLVLHLVCVKLLGCNIQQ